VVAVDALASEAHRGTGVKAAVMPGCKDGELYYEVPVGDGEHALVVADLLFNLREHYGGIHGLILRYVTASTGFFGMTRVARFVNLKSVGPLRDFLLDMARRRDLSMIVVGHGPPVTDNVSEHFREAAGLL
jgi:hypothetical protein